MLYILTIQLQNVKYIIDQRIIQMIFVVLQFLKIRKVFFVQQNNFTIQDHIMFYFL